MIKTTSKLFLVITPALAISFASIPSLAGEIIRPNSQSNFEWKSTECLKPTPPPISSNQSSSDRLTKYALDIELYIDCLQREGQRDFDKSQIAMQDAVQDELEKQTRIMDEMMRQAAKTMR